MTKISADLIKEIEIRADNTTLQEIAVEILEQIGNGSSNEYLRDVIRRRVDIVVREEEK